MRSVLSKKMLSEVKKLREGLANDFCLLYNSKVNNPRRKQKMKKGHISLVFFSMFLLVLIGSLLFGEQQRPDIMIYDKNLNKIPLSNLYKGSLLVIQWGGCT